MESESIVDYLKSWLGKPWPLVANSSPIKSQSNGTTITTNDQAQYPEWDEFYLLVCDICGIIIKPQALEKHLATKHRINVHQTNHNHTLPTVNGKSSSPTTPIRKISDSNNINANINQTNHVNNNNNNNNSNHSHNSNHISTDHMNTDHTNLKNQLNNYTNRIDHTNHIGYTNNVDYTTNHVDYTNNVEHTNHVNQNHTNHLNHTNHTKLVNLNNHIDQNHANHLTNGLNYSDNHNSTLNPSLSKSLILTKTSPSLANLSRYQDRKWRNTFKALKDAFL